MHDKILDRDLCDPIRDFLNCTQKGQKFRNFLIRSPNDWDRLCAALDAAEDAHLAIQAFLSTHFQIKHRPKEGFGALDDGQKYLYLYGVFQAVVVQQDAIEHIREIVATYCGGVAESSEGGVWYASCKCARDLRKYRNLCVGHPVINEEKRLGHRNNIASCYIIRNSLAEDLGQFAISGWDAKDNQDKQEEIQLVAMLQDYIRAAKAEIVDIRKALDQCALKVGQ